MRFRWVTCDWSPVITFNQLWNRWHSRPGSDRSNCILMTKTSVVVLRSITESVQILYTARKKESVNDFVAFWGWKIKFRQPKTSVYVAVKILCKNLGGFLSDFFSQTSICMTKTSPDVVIQILRVRLASRIRKKNRCPDFIGFLCWKISFVRHRQVLMSQKRFFE